MFYLIVVFLFISVNNLSLQERKILYHLYILEAVNFRNGYVSTSAYTARLTAWFSILSINDSFPVVFDCRAGERWWVKLAVWSREYK